jgi:hypothetical protein
MSVLNSVVTATLVSAALATPALAEVAATTVVEKHEHAVALTLSPVHLMLPVVEVMGELRAHPKLGVAAIVGGGRVDDVSAYELGGQINYYLLGGFDHGMQLGVETMYLHADKTESGIAAAANALAVGPYVGYKVAMEVGFTFNAQLGVQAAVLKAEATSGTSMAMAEDKEVFPLLNLNVGWSF